MVRKKDRGVFWLVVFFQWVLWLSVTPLLSLKLEFIFYKLEWNVFCFSSDYLHPPRLLALPDEMSTSNSALC